jgi:hypothetical protein
MSSRWSDAILAGIAAGIAMLACLIIGASHTGVRWDAPVRWIASLLLAEPALIMAGQAKGGMSAAGCVALGLAIHFVTAIVVARLFLILAGRLTEWRLPLAGVAYGAALWAIMAFVLLRLFDDVLYARVRLLPLNFLAAHLLYGTVIAGICSVRHRRIGQMS